MQFWKAVGKTEWWLSLAGKWGANWVQETSGMFVMS